MCLDMDFLWRPEEGAMTAVSAELNINLQEREMPDDALRECVHACLTLAKYSNGLVLKVGSGGTPLRMGCDDVRHFRQTVAAMLAQKTGFSVLMGREDGDMPSATAIRVGGKPATMRQVEGLNLRLDSTAFVAKTNGRIRACLSYDNHLFLGELVSRTEAEILRIPDFGRRSLVILRMVLQEYGLGFGDTVEGWEKPKL